MPAAMAITWLACFSVANVVRLVAMEYTRLNSDPLAGDSDPPAHMRRGGLLAWSILDIFRPDVMALMGWSRRSVYLALLIVPAVMIRLALVEYGGRERPRE